MSVSTAPVTQSVSALKGAYRGARAAVVLGGTSMVAQAFDFTRLRDSGFVTFLESKALTPLVMQSGWVPDFYLLLSPDKALNNALHNWIFRAFMAGVRIEPLLRPEWRPVAADMRAGFDEYLQPGDPGRSPHKRLRWRPSVELPDSPAALLRSLPETRVLAPGRLLDRHCPQLAPRHPRFVYEQLDHAEPFEPHRYYGVDETDAGVVLRNCNFVNSAAIALYPLLRYLGFRQVYVLGMDMSMLGSLEYGAPYTFRTMWHFRYFFRRARRVFAADYQPNPTWYLRPTHEFDALRRILDPEYLDVVRVEAPYRYSARLPFVPSVSIEEFWRA